MGWGVLILNLIGVNIPQNVPYFIDLFAKYVEKKFIKYMSYYLNFRLII